MNNILKKSFIVVSIMAMGFSAKAEKIWSIDFAKGDKTLKLYNGAKIITDKGKRVLDLGYKQPGSKAYATAEVPVADLRSGSISFKFRPGYHLLKKRKSGNLGCLFSQMQMSAIRLRHLAIWILAVFRRSVRFGILIVCSEYAALIWAVRILKLISESIFRKVFLVWRPAVQQLLSIIAISALFPEGFWLISTINTAVSCWKETFGRSFLLRLP